MIKSCFLTPHFKIPEGIVFIPSFQSCLGLCYRFSVAFMLNLCSSIHEYRETQQDILNVMGALYATVIFLGITNASTVQPIVAVERSVFYRERAAGMYAPMPYAIAQVQTKVQTLKLLITVSLLWRCTGTPWQCLQLTIWRWNPCTFKCLHQVHDVCTLCSQ